MTQSPRPRGFHPLETDDPTTQLMVEVLADFDIQDKIEKQIAAIVGQAKTPEELTPQQLADVEQLLAQAQQARGGLSEKDFFMPRLRVLEQNRVQILRANGLNTGKVFSMLENIQTGAILRSIYENSANFTLILAPDTKYRLTRWKVGATFRKVLDFESGSTGSQTEAFGGVIIPNVLDADLDGLSNEVERIVGSDLDNPDTDGDGIVDGVEVNQGGDPLSGLAVRTGIIASADTPGNAVDISALDNLVVVADSEAGVSIFNVFNGLNPSLVAQVPTVGPARSVSLSGNYVAAAIDSAGVAVIDVSAPSSAKVLHYLNLGASAQAVATAGSLAMVGLDSGQVISIDMATGSTLGRLGLNGPVQDLVIGGDTLYALTLDTLYAISFEAELLKITGSVGSSGAPGGWRKRLFVGGGLVYASFDRGYHIYSLQNPGEPAFVSTFNSGEFYWKQIIANGSGIGLAARGLNPAAANHCAIFAGPDRRYETV